MSAVVNKVKEKVIQPAIHNTIDAANMAAYGFRNPGDPIGAGLAPIKNAGVALDNEGGNLGIRKSSAQKAATADEENAAAEAAARTAAYNDSINDKSIDTTTRGDIQQAYSGGADSATLAGIIAAARQGKGVYGVRRINQNQQERQANTPGRAQVLGGGSIL